MFTTNNMQIFLDYLFVKRSTCFGRFNRPSSAAHNCTVSFMYCQPILLQTGIVDRMELLGVWYAGAYAPTYQTPCSCRESGMCSCIPERESGMQEHMASGMQEHMLLHTRLHVVAGSLVCAPAYQTGSLACRSIWSLVCRSICFYIPDFM